jgi:thioredoxin 1
MSSNLTQGTEWDSLVSRKKLVAADFWGPWSPFCLRLKSVFESMANKYPDITFVKINVDEQ